jgi:putative Mg2+ transporter-C (MgtC) family protein
MDAWIDSFIGGSMELTTLVRVFLAILLGFILGLEREMYKRPAGLRTHILVCIASCLIMLVSMYGFEGGDPARVAAQVVSGVGFLGAGAIMREDKGNGIKGITTAATIWMSAMIGLACGNGFYFGAILVTVCALIILTILRRFELKISASSKYKSKIFLTVKFEEDVLRNIRTKLQESDLVVDDLESKIVNVNKEKAIKVSITFEKNSSLDNLYNFVSKIESDYSPIELKLSHE